MSSQILLVTMIVPAPSVPMVLPLPGLTAASTSETTDSISKLAALAAQLRESVAGFRLPDPAQQSAEQPEYSAAEALPGINHDADDLQADDTGAVAYVDQRTA